MEDESNIPGTFVRWEHFFLKKNLHCYTTTKMELWNNMLLWYPTTMLLHEVHNGYSLCFSLYLFHCVPTSGVPEAELTWFRNKTKLVTDLHIHDGSLLIQNVSISDQGLYSCRAANIRGEVTESTQLLVLGKLKYAIFLRIRIFRLFFFSNQKPVIKGCAAV